MEQDSIWTSGVLRYTLGSLTNGVGYDVQVRAVNAAGEGSWSATASATPQTVTDAPTINQITPGDGALAVSWTPPAEDGGSAITSYDVRYIRSDAGDKSDDNWTVGDGIWTSGPLSYELARTDQRGRVRRAGARGQRRRARGHGPPPPQIPHGPSPAPLPST